MKTVCTFMGGKYVCGEKMEAAADRFYAASVSSCQEKLVWFWITNSP